MSVHTKARVSARDLPHTLFSDTLSKHWQIPPIYVCAGAGFRKEGKTKLSRYNSFPATKVFRGLSSLSGTLTLPGEEEGKGEFATPFLFYFCRKERRRGNRIKKKTLSFRLSAFSPFCHKVPSRSFLFPPLEAKKTQPKGKKKIGAKRAALLLLLLLIVVAAPFCDTSTTPSRRRSKREKLSFFVYFSLAVSKYTVQNAQNCRYDAKTFSWDGSMTKGEEDGT